jgi:hypothetical protein
VATPRRLLSALWVVPLLACSGHHVVVGPAPASPEATVGQFLAAVNANDHARMAQLFGDERGPSTVTIKNPARRDSVITVLQQVLLTDSAHLLGTEPVPGKPERRLVRADLFIGDHKVAVPFTLAPQRRGGWLVAVIDILPLMPSANTRPRP